MEQKAYNYASSLPAIQLPDYRDSQNMHEPVNAPETEATMEQSTLHVNTFPTITAREMIPREFVFGLHAARCVRLCQSSTPSCCFRLASSTVNPRVALWMRSGNEQ